MNCVEKVWSSQRQRTFRVCPCSLSTLAVDPTWMFWRKTSRHLKHVWAANISRRLLKLQRGTKHQLPSSDWIWRSRTEKQRHMRHVCQPVFTPYLPRGHHRGDKRQDGSSQNNRPQRRLDALPVRHSSLSRLTGGNVVQFDWVATDCQKMQPKQCLSVSVSSSLSFQRVLLMSHADKIQMSRIKTWFCGNGLRLMLMWIWRETTTWLHVSVRWMKLQLQTELWRREVKLSMRWLDVNVWQDPRFLCRNTIKKSLNFWTLESSSVLFLFYFKDEFLKPSSSFVQSFPFIKKAAGALTRIKEMTCLTVSSGCLAVEEHI